MNRLSTVVRTATALCVASMLATAPPARATDPSVADIMAGIQSRWVGLNSYEVPVTVTGNVKVSIISVPFRMTGTQYYQSPNKQILHIDNPPSMARGLGNTLSAMGTPQTWSQDYAISFSSSLPHKEHQSYILTGIPKREGSRVKSVTMSVSSKTYGIESMKFLYTNGATLDVTLERKKGLTQYHLPRSADVVARFPGYSGNATIVYGQYVLNPTIPPETFEQH